MTYEILLINIGYGIVFLALAIKEVLWLRITLSFAQSLIMYNNLFISHNYITASWNFIFVAVNVIQVIIIYNERKPRYIPKEFSDLYSGMFSTFTSKEFLYLLHMGDVISVNDTQIINEGQKQDDLLLMIKGKCNVMKNNLHIATLKRGQFIGELSFITSQPASASVVAKGNISYISWNQIQIKIIKKTNSAFYSKFHNALTEDIANKMIN